MAAGERPGLVVLTIELEGALAKTPGVNVPCKLTSPYRAPLTKFLNKYSTEAITYFLEFTRLQVRVLSAPPPFLHRPIPLPKPSRAGLGGAVEPSRKAAQCCLTTGAYRQHSNQHGVEKVYNS